MKIVNAKRLWRGGTDIASFSGVNALSKRTGIHRSTLKQQLFPYLNTYTTFRATRRPKIYNPYFVRVRRKILQSDIIFMTEPKGMYKLNSGCRYILIVQDIYTRKIWTRPIKAKDADNVFKPLKEILDLMSPFAGEPRFVIDRGTEYRNKKVKELLKIYNLSIVHPASGHAPHVERANLSLQKLLYMHMHETGVRKWLHYLPTATDIMNSREHRIIRMSPNEAEDESNRTLLDEAMSLYRDKPVHAQLDHQGLKKKKSIRFKIGDKVRLQKFRSVFNRGYLPTFTNEVFKIMKVLDHLPITMYKIAEWDGTEIEGHFYPEELTLFRGNVFKLEKILKRGMRNGIPSAFVKWKGFKDKYNSWVPLSKIEL